jgi:hypothetical protein
MSLTAIHLKQFTAFDDLRVEFSPGINVFVGTNGAYAACDIENQLVPSFLSKLVGVFMPTDRALWRLCKRRKGHGTTSAAVWRGDLMLYSDHEGPPNDPFTSWSGEEGWLSEPIRGVYIPVKEMLANAPGFRSLYAQREIHFEDVYDDILVRAYLPPLREPAHSDGTALLEQHMGGKVVVKGEEFFLQSSEGELEFSLVAEGIRKLGLLWLLIRNGSLQPESVLFWDEPETNLSPRLYGVVIDVLLQLQRTGVQVFLATHDYVVLKELDLQSKPEDKIRFHALHRSKETNEVECHSVEAYGDIHPNAISDTFDDLYDRDVRRSLGAMRP